MTHSTEHWAHAHRWQNLHWLADTAPTEVLEKHQADQFLVSPGRVMDIGVGTGKMAEYLASAGHRVHCVDIVEEAFENCKPHCDVFSDVAALRTLKPMLTDVAICHLVAQYCDDQALLQLLEGVFRHLRDDGVLTLQFAAPFHHSCDVLPQNNLPQGEMSAREQVHKGQLHLRWAHRLEQLVHQAGGHVTSYVDHRLLWEQGGIRHHTCHIKKGRRVPLGALTDIYEPGHVKLSLLIATIPSRTKVFHETTLSPLLAQAAGKPVEVLTLGDNCQRSVGDKRNALLQIARGDFLAFIDDDDYLAPDYVDEILWKIQQHPQTDLIIVPQMAVTPSASYNCLYDVELANKNKAYHAADGTYHGPPDHKQVWRASLAKTLNFPSTNFGEDVAWSWELAKRVRDHQQIDRVLYHYHFMPELSGTRTEVLKPAQDLPEQYYREDVDNTKPFGAFIGSREQTLRASVVIATCNKAPYLRRTLESIFRQRPSFYYEVIVVDHGSTDHTAKVVDHYYRRKQPIRYEYLPYEGIVNPAAPRNLGYRLATGEIVVSQSDDVIHATPEVLEGLISSTTRENFTLARVWDCVVDDDLEPVNFNDRILYCGEQRKEFPLFFLGAVHREHIYQIGGNSLRFHRPGWDDNWFTDCLMHGLGLHPVFLQVEGYHQRHPARHVPEDFTAMEAVYRELKEEATQTGNWLGTEPWPYV